MEGCLGRNLSASSLGVPSLCPSFVSSHFATHLPTHFCISIIIVVVAAFIFDNHRCEGCGCSSILYPVTTRHAPAAPAAGPRDPPLRFFAQFRSWIPYESSKSPKSLNHALQPPSRLHGMKRAQPTSSNHLTSERKACAWSEDFHPCIVNNGSA